MKTVPDFRDMETLAGEIKRPCLIPIVYSSPDFENPAGVYRGLRKENEASYLLESLTGPRRESRYSVIGSDPQLHLKIKNSDVEVDGRPGIAEVSRRRIEPVDESEDELEVLRRAMFVGDMRILSFDLPRYVLGFTGYLSYDFVRKNRGLETDTTDDLNHPLLEFMLPGNVIVFDHREEKTYYASLMLLTEDVDFGTAFSESLDSLSRIVSSSSLVEDARPEPVAVSSNFEKEDFESGVERIKDYILAGDVIQTVLSRRIDLEPSPDLGSFYSRLREINPSPYMFFLDFPETKLIGSSPEALVRVQDKEVLTRPIAGTRKRGRNEKDDSELERDLRADDKEKAEHVMLVDLGRNDIGKVSEFGTVDTTEFMDVEKYGDVQHLVSTVSGRIRDDKDAFDALRSVFPAGTVTGAPKVRAMEIIEELEPTRRGIYSGAVGSFSYTGDADFAITIRTLTESEGKAQIQVGAGIVADSVPEKEYYETESKARSLLRAAGVEDEDSGDR